MVCDENVLESLCLVTCWTFVNYKGTSCCFIKCFFISYDRMHVRKKIVVKKSLLREPLFPSHTNSLVKICDLRSFVLKQSLLAATDDDAVRVCFIYVLCEGFLGKEANDRVPQD
uniref:Uncharacterized protein n=1 Tax=Lactuca sativa TaxID=4236 RepID=A0A9R1XA36_LACSA|nr:hypothetical protein LSAT_V11C500257850 [Lactuca sativa]